ncbi:MAG: class I SAM-dependent methyltransferase [Candidatus Helarchaeota archaeon]|nr:class I SAM-dependent methyltransferase [Candidatus Helarchaeota archaeon]
MDLIFELHADLPREGPGSNEFTRKAFLMLKNLPQEPKILDIGCGSGMQTIEIAKLTEGKIIALDIHEPFLNRLEKRAIKEGVSKKIEAVKGTMLAMDFEENSFDLIWSEGALYFLGFEKGLKEIKRFLKQGGYVVVSELCWIKKDPPEEVRDFFQTEYPGMQSIEHNKKVINDSSYQLLGFFILPKSAWWDNYYTPLEKRLKILRKKYKDDPEAKKLLDSTQDEIDIFRKYSDSYGYIFFIMKDK